jgi:hypothetical protein
MSLVSLVEFKLLDDQVRALKEEFDSVNFLQWHHQTFHNAAGSNVDIQTAYNSFKSYCQNNNHDTPTWQEFSKLMAKHSKKKRNAEGRMEFYGVGLNNGIQESDGGWEMSSRWGKTATKTTPEAAKKWSKILDEIPVDRKELRKKKAGQLSFGVRPVKKYVDEETEAAEEQELCEGLIRTLVGAYKTGKSLKDRYLARKNKTYHTVFYRHGGYDDGEGYNTGSWFVHSHHEKHADAVQASSFLKQFDVEKVRTLPLNRTQLRDAYGNPHGFMSELEGQLGVQHQKKEVKKLGAVDSFNEWHRINKDKLEPVPSRAGYHASYKNWAKKQGHDHLNFDDFETHIKRVGLGIDTISDEQRKKIGLYDWSKPQEYQKSDFNPFTAIRNKKD